MGKFSSQVFSLLSRSAPEQGGVMSGDNPSVFNAADPFQLWVIQLIIIIAMSRLAALILSRLRQPRVFAEVIAGVILGPSVMGHIPGFTQAIFPAPSLPFLSLTGTIGLILFLFLVGLEIDTRLMRRSFMSSISVSLAGLIVPLGMGAALGVAIYREFASDTVNFGYFLLFVAVAVGITAFPVLCRILAELKLLDTEVGLVTLSAGVSNDVAGWILLALTVALVNASTGLMALWVLLASAGYALFLFYPGRWALRWMAKRTGSLDQGSPTIFMMTIILFIIFISAFYTDIIGVHPIFGGFLAGLIIPHDNGFAISIIEKLEDLVSIVFLPLYFILSGLKTDLGLLNTGTIWGYIILICLVAFGSKFLACAGAARFSGHSWRESGAIGALMSCKALVEIIVLTIGQEANILTTQTFSMFVVQALVLTFLTTPLVILFYPPQYRVHHKVIKGDESTLNRLPPSSDGHRTKFAIVLDKAESLPPAMTLSRLLQAPTGISTASFLSSIDENAVESDRGTTIDVSYSWKIYIEALRLMELTSRTSALLRSQEINSLLYNDPVVSVYTTFCQLNNLKVSVDLSIVNFDEFSEAVEDHASGTRSQMVIIPWPRGPVTFSVENQSHGIQTAPRNTSDGILHRTSSQDQTQWSIYSEYIRRVFATSSTEVALFVERDPVSVDSGSARHHLFLAFFGGPDDRLALSFLVQLCERPSVTATVVRFNKSEAGVSSSPTKELVSPTHNVTFEDGTKDTIYAQQSTQIRLDSETADNVLWNQYTQSKDPHPFNVASALSRISFKTEMTSTPLRRVTELVRVEAAENRGDKIHSKTLIVLAGRSRRMATESMSTELRALTSDNSSIRSTVPKTIGDVGAALVTTGVNASLLILQASLSSKA